MLFGKLLPKEGNFFELFNQHADWIVQASRAFSNFRVCAKATRRLRSGLSLISSLRLLSAALA